MELLSCHMCQNSLLELLDFFFKKTKQTSPGLKKKCVCVGGKTNTHTPSTKQSNKKPQTHYTPVHV